MPLFKCTLKDADDNILQEFRGDNPTSVMKKSFEWTSVNTKRRWNGNDFFGVTMKDVKTMIAKARELPSDMAIIKECGNMVYHSDSRNISWVGVDSLGYPEEDPQYKKEITGHVILLQPGYMAPGLPELTLKTQKTR